MKAEPRSVALAGLSAVLLAWLPWLGPAAYPFRLLATTVHELGHGIAALLTGGGFHRYVVFADGSGQAITSGGWRWIIVPAGYLGVSLFAVALLLAGRSRKGGRFALGVVGSAMALLSLRYAVPTILTERHLAGLLTLATGVGLGSVLLAVGFKARATAATFLLHLVAFHTALTGLGDLWVLAGISQLESTRATDAHSMADLALLPALFWALLWGTLSIAVTLWALSLRWQVKTTPRRRSP